MNLHIEKLNYKFLEKPLLVGGKAKEYYGIRKSGLDIDFVITKDDYNNLSKQYLNNLKDLWGDSGICVFDFEIWKTICLFDYDFLSKDAIEKEEYLIISLDKLLFMTALAADKKPRYKIDLDLIVKKVFELQYKNFDDSQYRQNQLKETDF